MTLLSLRFDGVGGFRLNGSRRSVLHATVGGVRVAHNALSAMAGDWSWLVGEDGAATSVRVNYHPNELIVGDRRFAYATVGEDTVIFDHGDALVVAPARAASAAAGLASDGSLRAPMPGKIVATPARAGDAVTKGQPVIVLEAMKMEHALVAPFDGVVAEIAFTVGDQVAADAVLAKVEAA